MTLKSELLLRDLGTEARVYPFQKIPGLIRGLGEFGLRPIVVQGVFDFLHFGHNGLCEAAQALDPVNGVVLAGLDNDATVRQNKGEGRPVNPLADRLHMIAAMRPVAFAFGYTDIPRYDDPEAYLARWRALSGATVVVSSLCARCCWISRPCAENCGQTCHRTGSCFELSWASRSTPTASGLRSSASRNATVSV